MQSVLVGACSRTAFGMARRRCGGRGRRARGADRAADVAVAARRHLRRRQVDAGKRRLSRRAIRDRGKATRRWRPTSRLRCERIGFRHVCLDAGRHAARRAAAPRRHSHGLAQHRRRPGLQSGRACPVDAGDVRRSLCRARSAHRHARSTTSMPSSGKRCAPALPTAPFTTWHMARGPFRPEINSRFQLAFGDYAGPFVVKPVSGRASLHVHVVEDRAGIAGRRRRGLRRDREPRADREIPVGPRVLHRGGRTGDGARAAARARAASRSRSRRWSGCCRHDEKIFTSMDVRPITRDRCHGLDREQDAGAARPSCTGSRATSICEFNLGSLIRLDVRSDENGKLYILEANPKPDLKKPAAA